MGLSVGDKIILGMKTVCPEYTPPMMSATMMFLKSCLTMSLVPLQSRGAKLDRTLEQSDAVQYPLEF